jgi:hypothetical protein
MELDEGDFWVIQTTTKTGYVSFLPFSLTFPMFLFANYSTYPLALPTNPNPGSSSKRQ